MQSLRQPGIRGRPSSTPLWVGPAPIREERFGLERLERHAQSLAVAQQVTPRPPRVPPLDRRLKSNAVALLADYRSNAAEAEKGGDIVPAAEWLLDNYHLVEKQIRQIHDHLPAGYYRQLPKLAAGPLAGYPRVFGLAWAFIAHTDSHIDPVTLRCFIRAYQRIQPLMIGELWAVAITLRIVLVENLRRLSAQIVLGRSERADADALADRLLASGGAKAALDADIATRSDGPLSEVFAAQLAKRLRDQDPTMTPAIGWLSDRLEQQGVSIETVVSRAQQRLGTSNVSIRNVINSMRLISDIDWTEFVESISLVDERLCAGSRFASMDFPTRDLYRAAIEALARGSALSEGDVTDHAIRAATEAARTAPTPEMAERVGDPGFHLIGHGRRALEQAIGFRPTYPARLGRLGRDMGLAGYVGAMVVLTTLVLALPLWCLSLAGLSWGGLAMFAILGGVPATEVATALVNRLATWRHGPVILPGLDLSAGIPGSARTLVAVPTLLTRETDLRDHIESMEVHYLSGAGGDITFALLSDGADADHEVVDSDAGLLSVAVEAIAALNRRHGPGPDGDRFLFLHRHRRFNPKQGVWMGWERKRGKLVELNRLLRGATDTSFATVGGVPPHVPDGVRYVITLDADTRLPRDAARRLVGKMSHPLNRPILDPARRRVSDGYGILQPRVTPSLPRGGEGSLFQRVFSGPAGMDPYAAAVSDVYQDVFGEGSFAGKGIYDVDAFEAALSGRVPENALLSHDLFEGLWVRAGLASDVEVVEDFPSRHDVAAKRQHRWIRGDWQLLPWVFGHWSGPAAPSLLGRWKMLDNLRRSLLAPFLLFALAACWVMPTPAAWIGIAFVMAAMALPAFLPSAFAILPRRSGLTARSHFDTLGKGVWLAMVQVFLSVCFLPDQTRRAVDAIGRTVWRLFVTRRDLLEWTTAATSTAAPRLDLPGFYGTMRGGMALGLILAAGAVVIAPSSWLLILPVAVSWAAMPAIAYRISRPSPRARRLVVSDADRCALRLVARRTWRFFETFVTKADSFLPPDNFQVDPAPVLAHRTSPTNIGLYLLSTVAARDFGWAGTTETVERLEATLTAMDGLARYKGHFLNWYDTRDGHVLDPAYVSSVDSGNLAGHLIALANACEEWATPAPGKPDAPLNAPEADVRAGLMDTLRLARLAIADLPAPPRGQGPSVSACLDEIETLLEGAQGLDLVFAPLNRLAGKAAEAIRDSLPMADDDDLASDPLFWIDALRTAGLSHARDRQASEDEARHLVDRVRARAAQARAMAMAMDFTDLLNSERMLLSIGYSLADNGLDANCYDLLASEARLASLFAIAKGDVPTRHWFRLGRGATPMGSGSALISWSGSMFEYLMPSLVMRAPLGSVLEQTNRLAVAVQQAHARTLDIPWGVSESAFNARDLELTYQYSSFGVPGLGLKRGLAGDAVVAPYATALGAMVDPHGARRNFDRLAGMGALGRHGFFDALDFTRSRIPGGETVAIVRTFMAHHQGMTIVALANTVTGGRMRDRFHRDPMVKACALLLQERVPQDVAVARPAAEGVRTPVTAIASAGAATRRLSVAASGAPATHLLSNGCYAVMLTATGGGYSRWGSIAVTRWREDAAPEDGGTCIVLRDRATGKRWTASASPAGDEGSPPTDVLFSEDHAQFIGHDGTLTTTMDVLVSGEDDGEVRQVSLTNSGVRSREVELTSYAELVLAPVAADAAHPAFSRMFVQTAHLADYEALTATRRPRSGDEPGVWAAHFAVVEGEIAADPEYETDRARFLGRGGSTLSGAVAMRDGQALSNTVGTVLDPVFSLRRCVRIPGGSVARVSFWTVVASTQAALLDLIDKHHDRNAFDRAKTLAWTQAQVELRHIGIGAAEAMDFQTLAAPILYEDPRYRMSAEVIARGAGPQSGLWPLGISGDLPIVLLRIDDSADMAVVGQMLQAHEYWRMKQVAVDLVIVNEHPASYIQDLQTALEAAVRKSQSRPRLGESVAAGAVHVLRRDLVPQETRDLLAATARVVLHAQRGSVADQIARAERPAAGVRPKPRHPDARPAQGSPHAAPHSAPGAADLEYFNGFGGFARDGREYVTVLTGDETTPAPWINVIANAEFGFQVSAEGAGYTWAVNSRENPLTRWSNDPVIDPSGEAILVRDDETGAVWSPMAWPRRDGGTYVARHGFGYSRFEHEAEGVALDLIQFVPRADPIKISRLTLRNRSGQRRRLSVTAAVEWMVGIAPGTASPFLLTGRDDETGAIFTRNPWGPGFPDRVAFTDLGGRQTSWTTDRAAFHGDIGAPASDTAGVVLDRCVALSATIDLADGEETDVVWFMGECASDAEARALIARSRRADLDAVLADVTNLWAGRLGAVQVRTPDRAMDIMLNGWLLYQTLACRILARSGFYQASGAYGFRDQLQDGMALTFACPEETRAHLLRAAARQFVEGDVQHWWLPHSGQGTRTRISDDRIWLVFAVASYVATSGDTGVLDETVSFLEGQALRPGAHDAFFTPTLSDRQGSLFEHCALALDRSLALLGPHGLPLMGTGDWNDGMNRVGENGQGESVWLAWLIARTVALFAPLATDRADARVQGWQAQAAGIVAAVEREAWDGDWYRRATFDDGTWLGTRDGDACHIDSIAQSWAVLSEVADPDRAARAMAALDRHLVRRQDRLVLLFTPPFDSTTHDPGYIRGYPPGLRENGGQYTHAAMWAILAFAKLGDGAKAAELFAMLNPITHARRHDDVQRYKVEPYVVAADVYSQPPHVGRGGWTWYTGSAAWMYRAGVEGILGLRREGRDLVVDPRIPDTWPGFEATVTVAGTRCDIRVKTALVFTEDQPCVALDGARLTARAGAARIPLDGASHALVITLTRESAQPQCDGGH
ncbi:glycosyl transferase [Roseospira marina]|uniref:Glycosyl transferase n=1 Tax=Roseospira marina TaxID=140057 RepID=A0A5M6I7A1_9PROT|nr:glucoamylase family protein [Roseospira marina]KAA5604003.1 glycosyl transferase [Roseospira marina]MBB4315895.1 cyclic beta-1,2-glucan synthetase [Roseospira marina]MBB5089059.1 cyclic beta-1,2-glucan synthetase [Roseospira marina]